MNTHLEVSALKKAFVRESHEVVKALDDVSIAVPKGELLVLLGPSGCGKTTLLRSIAGLESPDSGQITIAGRTVFSSNQRIDLASERRGLSMVFQSYALWPHMTTFSNVAYPLRFAHRTGGSRLKRSEIQAKVQHALDLVGIPELASQYPGQMSGGQQQRVALARAIVRNDDLILFDEPLSNVDARVRDRLRIELRSMHSRFGFTGVYVTHDQAEALQLGTTVAVMRRGEIVQFGEPREIYEKPVNRYVANFLGISNELPGTLVGKSAESVEVETSLGRLVSSAETPTRERATIGTEVVAVVRPERLNISHDEPTGPNKMQGRVSFVAFAGAYAEYAVMVDDRELVIHSPHINIAVRGDDVWLSANPTDVRILDAEAPTADTAAGGAPAATGGAAS